MENPYLKQYPDLMSGKKICAWFRFVGTVGHSNHAAHPHA